MRRWAPLLLLPFPLPFFFGAGAAFLGGVVGDWPSWSSPDATSSDSSTVSTSIGLARPAAMMSGTLSFSARMPTAMAKTPRQTVATFETKFLRQSSGQEPRQRLALFFAVDDRLVQQS